MAALVSSLTIVALADVDNLLRIVKAIEHDGGCAKALNLVGLLLGSYQCRDVEGLEP
jgi:hypothetical protein